MEEKFEGKGIIRRVDELGRIVLPREMRKMLDIREGTRLQIGIVEGDKFLLSKYMPMNNMRDYAPTAINAMQCVIEHDILITNLEQVVCSTKKKYLAGSVSIIDYLEDKNSLLQQEQLFANSKATRLMDYITLYKALGGELWKKIF